MFVGIKDKDAIDLLSKLLVYDPEQRMKPLEALAHPFFLEIRDSDKVDDDEMDFLFDFTPGKIIWLTL